MKATKRTKTAAKKSKSMKKGKSLESVKPLTKIAAARLPYADRKRQFDYNKLEWKYTQQ